MRNALHVRLFISLMMVCGMVGASWGQTYVMNGSPINDCDGTFTDSGGNSNGYGPNQNLTTVICSNSTTTTHVQLLFSSLDIAPGDLLTFYDGNTATPANLITNHLDYTVPFGIGATAANASGCITVVFTSNATGQGAGWSASLNCTRACQTIVADILDTTPAISPVDTGWIDICPGQRIFLTGQGIYPQNGLIYSHSDFTSSFEWNFGDGATAVGPSASHTYTEPGGYFIELTITDQLGCKNNNFIRQRVRVSPPPNFNITGNIDTEICSRDTVHLSAVVNSSSSDAVFSVTPNTGSFQVGGVVADSLPLPDDGSSCYTSPIEITNFTPGQTLTDIDDLLGICVVMEHSWMHDLEISLTCPSGNRVILHNYVPTNTEGAGVTFLGVPNDPDQPSPTSIPTPWGLIQPGEGWDYCWTPTATRGTWRQYATATRPGTLPEGDYNSFTPLTTLLGCPLNGLWTIEVCDRWGADNGFMFEWSINFNADIYPSLEVFTPMITDYTWINNPTIFDFSRDSISAAPPNAGSAIYTFSVTNDFGCTFDSLVTINVLPETHPDCRNCEENFLEQPDLVLCPGESAPMNVGPQPGVDLETTIRFDTYPLAPFGRRIHGPENPFEGNLNINSIAPLTLTNPLLQIASVCVDITTDWNSDIDLFLRAPNGNQMMLSTGNGGGSDNYTNTCFTPNPADPLITSGTGPFTGNFRPEGAWTDLGATPINGDWQLVAIDRFGINDVGSINSWSITFNSINSYTYLWNPTVGLSCTNCPTPTANPVNSTNYRVQITDAYGCVSRDTIQVTRVANLTAPQVTCMDTDDGEVIFNWTAVPGFTEYEINLLVDGVPQGWTGPVSGLTFTSGGYPIGTVLTLQVRPYFAAAPLCAVPEGTSSCEVTGCGLEVAEPTVAGVSCVGLTDGTVTITATGAAPITYQLDGGPAQASGVFNNLSAGPHIITITDGNGCSIPYPIDVATPTLLEVTLDQVSPVSCFNGNNGVVGATASGGTPNYVFSFNGGPFAAQATFSNRPPGQQTVTVRDNNGCTATASFTLANPTELTVSLTPTNPSCAATATGQLTALATGGDGSYTYLWSNGVVNHATIANLDADNYCVTVTDGMGCTAVVCEDLQDPPALVIDSVSTTPVLCNGGNTGAAAIFVSGGSGGYRYLWSHSLAQITSTAVFLEAGPYQVTVTDNAGCQVVANAVVTEPAALAIVFDPTMVDCRDGSDGAALANVAGGIAPYTYRWSTTATTPEIAQLTAGVYTLTVTDANDCTAEASLTITQPATAVEVAASQTFLGCDGAAASTATVTAQGGAGTTYTYQWSNGQTTATATNLIPGMYAVTATDEKGCTAVTEVAVVDLAPVTFEILADPPSCTDLADGNLSITQIMGGTGSLPTDYTFLWNTGRNTLAIANLVGGQTYAVTVTDQQGCIGVGERFLANPAPITFEIEAEPALCQGDATGTARVFNVNGPNNTYTYRWSDNAGAQQTATAVDLPVGAYTVVITDDRGCTTSGTVQVTEPSALGLGFTLTHNGCFGDRNGAAQALPSGGVGNYTFLWSNGAATNNLSNLAAGDYTLTLTDANGCILVSTATVTQPEALMAEVTARDVTCFGDRNGSLQVTPSGGTPPFKYSLDNRLFVGSSNLIGLTAGDYAVFVRDAEGCTFLTSATVNEPAEFTLDAGPTLNIVYGDSIELAATATNAVGEVELVWLAPYAGTLSCTECPNPVARPEYTIDYEVYGIDENGCEATDFLRLIVEKIKLLVVPTGFTPNGDGQNDLLLVHGRPGSQILSFQVFDRWGELVYQANDFPVNDPFTGWDGHFRGQPLNGGVFLWSVRVRYDDGEEETLHGQTTLLR